MCERQFCVVCCFKHRMQQFPLRARHRETILRVNAQGSGTRVRPEKRRGRASSFPTGGLRPRPSRVSAAGALPGQETEARKAKLLAQTSPRLKGRERAELGFKRLDSRSDRLHLRLLVLSHVSSDVTQLKWFPEHVVVTQSLNLCNPTMGPSTQIYDAKV